MVYTSPSTAWHWSIDQFHRMHRVYSNLKVQNGAAPAQPHGRNTNWIEDFAILWVSNMHWRNLDQKEDLSCRSAKDCSSSLLELQWSFSHLKNKNKKTIMYDGFYRYKRKTNIPNTIKQWHIYNLRNRLFQKKYNVQVYFTSFGYLVRAEALFNIW